MIKPWVLPSGNEFIKAPSRRYVRPQENPGAGVAYVQPGFDDSSWRRVNLPHDWAIEGPFTAAGGGGMGRLPSAGVGWYRKKLNIPASDAGKSIFLDVDGAMSYSTVWLNGKISGRLAVRLCVVAGGPDAEVKPGGENELVIRLDNPPNSSRWYPGGGIYRNVWLVKTAPVHVGHWGTYLTTPEVTSSSATVNLNSDRRKQFKTKRRKSASRRRFFLDANGHRAGSGRGRHRPGEAANSCGCSAVAEGTAIVSIPSSGVHPRDNGPTATSR